METRSTTNPSAPARYSSRCCVAVKLPPDSWTLWAVGLIEYTQGCGSGLFIGRSFKSSRVSART
jgi:hypothetical protein